MEEGASGQRAIYVDYTVEGLNAFGDRVAYGLAYVDNFLNIPELKNHSDNPSNGTLLTCRLRVEATESEVGTCDVTKKHTPKGEKVIKMNGEDLYAGSNFITHEGDPSGWLAVSISASDGSVRAAASCGKCGGFCRRCFLADAPRNCGVSGQKN